MTSVLRQLQAEWNALVPQAQARRVPRVRLLNAPLETIAYRRTKLEWLRAQLGVTVAAVGDFSFGVEIECLLGCSQLQLVEKLAAAGVAVSRGHTYQHETVQTWKIVYDGSVRGRDGVEVVSPPLRGQAGFDQLQTVCRVLSETGARVNSSCGFHVHVGVQTEQPEFFKRLVKLYRKNEQVIDSFMAPSRRGNQNGFCSSVDRGSMVALEAAQSVRDVACAVQQQPSAARDSTRYRKLNLKPYWAYGTVEFRHHQGTVDAEKAANWVSLCLRMCLASKVKDVPAAATLDEFLSELDATPTEKLYFTSRRDNPAWRRAR